MFNPATVKNKNICNVTTDSDLILILETKFEPKVEIHPIYTGIKVRFFKAAVA